MGARSKTAWDRRMQRSGGRVTGAVLLCAAVIAPVAVSRDAEARLTLGRAAPGGKPAWLTYDRAPTFEVREEDVEVPVRDGSFLACRLFRPVPKDKSAAARYPSLVMHFNPYAAVNRTAFAEENRFFATRGYVTLQCTVRGTGGTPGEWHPFTRKETEDNYDAIEWLAAQPFSTGKVGQWGTSYGGISTNRVATLRPPHLAATAPFVSYQSAYHDIVFPGGIHKSDFDWWAPFTAGTAAPGQDPEAQGRMTRRGLELNEEHRQHPLYDNYWRERDVDVAALDAAKIPMLHIGGWYDLFQQGTPANYMSTRSHSYLLMLPIQHFQSVNSAPGAPPETLPALLSWFDHWLMGLPGAPLPGTRVTSWQMPASRGPWTELGDWPPPTATTSRYYYGSDGALTTDPGPAGPTGYTVNPHDSGCFCAWNTPDPEAPINDQRGADEGRLHFDTPAIDKGLTIAGTPIARIRASFTASDGYLIVRLNDVSPDGTSTLISTGRLRASHRVSHSQPEPVTPGQFYDFEVPIWPTHWHLASGHRLRLSISSGDVPRVNPDAPSGNVTIELGERGSNLELAHL